MTGRIFQIKKLAVHDGPGIRTTVFLKGCPLRCRWCHNPESISSVPQLAYLEKKCIGCGQCVPVCPSTAHTLEDGVHSFNRERCTRCGKCVTECLGDALIFYGCDRTVEDLLPALLEDRHFYEISGGGVTLSGGEPLLQADFSAALLHALKSKGIHTAVDTSGFANRDALEKIIPHTDLFLYDIKQIDEAKHIQYTGQSNRIILENLKYLCKRSVRLEIRIPLIPLFNNDPSSLSRMGSFLAGMENITRVTVLPYHSMAGSKYRSLSMENTMPGVETPSDEELNFAVNLLKGYGLRAVSGRD